MATPNIVPNAPGEGSIGTPTKKWGSGHFVALKKDGKDVATLDSPSFTGTPTSPSPSGPDNSTRIATTAWVRALLSLFAKIVGSVTNGRLCSFATGGIEDSGVTVADLKSRSNHTGTQPKSTITGLGSLAGKNTVGESDVDDGAITSNKIADSSVGSAKLSDSGAVAGTYKCPSIEIDAKGRIISASDGWPAKPSEVEFHSGLSSIHIGSSDAGKFMFLSDVDSIEIGNGWGASDSFVVWLTTKTDITSILECTYIYDEHGVLYAGLSGLPAGSYILFFGKDFANNEALWIIGLHKGLSSFLGKGFKFSCADVLETEFVLPSENPESGLTYILSSTGSNVDRDSFINNLGMNSGTVTLTLNVVNANQIKVGGATVTGPVSTCNVTIPTPAVGNLNPKFVLNTGEGITESSFRDALGLSSGSVTISLASLSATTVTAGTIRVNLGGGQYATIGCSASSSTSYEIPAPAGSTKVVLGDGVGVTDKSAFRAAIEAAPAGSYVGGDGSGVTNAESFRSAIESLRTPFAIGIASLVGAGTTSTNITASSTYCEVAVDSFAVASSTASFGFTVPDSTRAKIYRSFVADSTARTFLVDVVGSLDVGPVSGATEYNLALTINGSPTETVQRLTTATNGEIRGFSIHGCVNIKHGDTVALAISNLTDTTQPKARNINLTIRPI